MDWIDLPSPCLLVDRNRLEANLLSMQRKADAEQVNLRPHTKTHKSINLARRQVELGSHGVTVAKVGEAEVYAGAGIRDIRIANIIIGEEKYARILRLMDSTPISFCVDTMEGAKRASDWFSDRDRVADVLVEVDSGYGRCGVRWDDPESISFYRAVSDLPGLSIKGILTHAGHAYNGPESEDESKEAALVRVSSEERDHMLAFACMLANGGLVHPDTGFEISVGSTPSMRHFENREANGFRITEIRPGNYVFNDRIQVGLGVANWKQCALTVMATVISRHRHSDGSERLFLDAGKKVFTSDTAGSMSGYGAILYNPATMEPLPHANITGLSEEHGWVRVHGGSTLSVGDRVRVVPNHACVVVNTHRAMHVIDGSEVVEVWNVDAQSCLT
jgi:D-serine deaminase-like pyridoxal phosphate-dependent protein